MVLEHERQIVEHRQLIAKLKDQNMVSKVWSDAEIAVLEDKLCELENKIYSQLSPWSRLMICRHPDRPRSLDYINNICDEFVEIFGDRLFRDDPSIIVGFGIISGEKFVIIAQERGGDTASRIHRNFGMPYPEGYRKALRAMKLAEKFRIPVVSFLDTPGAYPGFEAEERGQGPAVAKNLFEMSMLKTPIVVILIGEGCSGGALAMGVGDIMGMLTHACYPVITPEGCAAILWRDSAKYKEAAESLKMQSEDLLELGIIDAIIDEHPGGAHHDPNVSYKSVKSFLMAAWQPLSKLPIDELLSRRYMRFRRMGKHVVDV